MGTRVTLKDVAAAVGYENPAYFCDLFRRIIGSSPRQYKQQHSR